MNHDGSPGKLTAPSIGGIADHPHLPGGLTFWNVFVAVVVLLPFWGYAVIPAGERGIQLNWLLSAGAAGVYIAQFLVGRSVIRDPLGTFLVFVLHTAVIASVYRPLMEGRPGMLTAWTTTYAQYAIGLGLILVVVNLRPGAAAVHGLLYLHLLVASGVALFGCVQLLGSAAGLDLNLRYLNPAMGRAVSSYSERTGGFARATGLFEEPRQFGGYLVGALIIAAGLLRFADLDARRRRRLWLVVPVLLAGLVSALSASAFISAAAAFALLVAMSLSARSGGRRFVPLLVAAVPATAIGLFVAYSDHVLAAFVRAKLRPPDLAIAWAQIINLDQGQWGWFRYLGSIGIALRTWATSPAVGVGLNNLEFYEVSVLSNQFTGAFGPARFLAETGLVGVVAFVLFIGYVLVRLRFAARRLRRWPAPEWLGLPQVGLLLVASVLVRSLATNLYGFPSIFFWAELALASLCVGRVRALNPDAGPGPPDTPPATT